MLRGGWGVDGMGLDWDAWGAWEMIGWVGEGGVGIHGLYRLSDVRCS